MDAETREREERNARAFNQGSQARIDGMPKSANPYRRKEARIANEEWVRGYDDAHYAWGDWVEGRWDYRPLPEVRRIA